MKAKQPQVVPGSGRLGKAGSAGARAVCGCAPRGKGAGIVARCRQCGCTDTQACAGGCWWVEPDLCSSCALVVTNSRGIQASRRRWTADEDETLRINFPMWPAFLIGHLVGHSASSVYQRAARLGIEKHPDHWRNPMAHLWNSTGHPNAIASRIKPGTVPANKGLRRPGYAPGRMAETMFKKGRPAREAHNYLPIGTEKIDVKRNNLVRKVTDDPSVFPAMRWRPVAVLVWEAANGPLPKGHVVRFRDGMKTLVSAEITLDRLELVTLAENMRRNTLHNYPKEITRAIQLRGALNRQINRLNREDRPHE